MFGIILIGHGKIATGFASALELFGCTMDKGCRVIEFLPEDSPEDVAKKLSEALDSLSNYDGTVIFTDIFFGTPYNMAVQQKLHRPEEHIEIVAGANLTVILETYMSRSSEISDVVSNSVELGKSQIILHENNVASENEDDDDI